MDEKTFDRVEKKYIISSANKKELLKVIKKNMKKDKFHKSGVFNIYFDKILLLYGPSIRRSIPRPDSPVYFFVFSSYFLI